MGNPRGFLEHTRELPSTRPVEIRVKDYHEIYQDFPQEKTVEQASRCMDCGVPFCHSGCPLGNVIPEFNDAVYRESWEEASQILLSTNPFPEFTGRICPAPCEAACVLGINQPPVAIEHIEKSIAERAWEAGYISPKPPAERSSKTVAVVGSGPAGLAAAAELNRLGHVVTVYERSDRIGGLLRYGIPDFKLEKRVIDRRLELMEAEGVRFETNADVGKKIDPRKLADEHDALILCGGSTIPRDLPIPGRDLEGIYFAMDFLGKNNRLVAGDNLSKEKQISAKGKHVVVIGGGDTGADCVGTSNRQGAASVTQIEIMMRPPNERAESTPWPNWPMMLRTSSSHEEGCEREWAILTKAFIPEGAGGKNGKVKKLRLASIKWGEKGFEEIPGTEREIPADLVLIAAGFVHPQFEGLLEKLNIELTERKNVKDENYRTNVDKVFVAGDMRKGQSLVVWAIQEGRDAAREIDRWFNRG